MNRTALVIFAAMAACATATRKSEFGAGTEVYEVGGLVKAEIDLVKVYGSRKIGVRLTLTNLSDREVRFKRHDISMDYRGRALPVRELTWSEMDIDLRPGQTKRKMWYFHTNEDPPAGDYRVTVKNFAYFNPATHARTAAPGTLVITVKVP